MQSLKACKWLCGGLICICLAQALYIYLASEKVIQPTRVISSVNVDEGGAIYEVLYDSGGATVPFIYRYYLLARQSNMGEVLERMKMTRPFLVTKSTAAVQSVMQDRVKLIVTDTIYDYNNIAFYKVNGKIKIIKFDLDSKMP